MVQNFVCICLIANSVGRILSLMRANSCACVCELHMYVGVFDGVFSAHMAVHAYAFVSVCNRLLIYYSLGKGKVLSVYEALPIAHRN